MVIKVLGSACANCRHLEALVREVVAEMGIEATIEKVTDIREIMSHHILATPGLVIDGHVVSVGRVPSRAEITTWLTNALMAAASE